MATSVVQSGDYLLELSTGWNWNAFHLADFATTQTRTNLVTNPSFETDTTNWYGVSATITRITTDSYIGSACLEVNKSAVVIGRVQYANSAANRIPVTPGLTYQFSAYVKIPSGQPSCSLRIRTREYTAAGTNQQSQFGSTTTVSDTDGWVRLSLADTPIANTVGMDWAIEETTANAKLWLVDGAIVEQSNTLNPYFDGTYYDQPYTGYSYISNTWTGTADASTSTSVWGLNTSNIYPESTLDNSTYVLDGTETFADITEFATLISYNRGRRKSDYQFGAGTMQFVMRDETGILGPYDTSSPYYDPANSQPGLAPLRKVRLSRDSEYLFVGHVLSYSYEFAQAGPNIVAVECADDFYLLAQTQLDAFNPSAETSGERIATVLALPEVDYQGTTSLDNGTVDLGHDSSYNVAAGTNTLAYLQQINQAEQGRLFMSRAGVLTFEPRIGATLSAPIISFADDGIGAKYQNLDVEFDADNVINRAYVQALDGKTATDSDPASIATYFTQSKSITNSLLHIQGQVDDLAAYLLEPNPEPRYTSVTTWFGSLSSTQRDDVATIDIGDTISIEKTIPGLGTQLATELAVEGINGVIDVNRGHTVTFYTSPTTIVYELILDDLVYGLLDGTNVLG